MSVRTRIILASLCTLTAVLLTLGLASADGQPQWQSNGVPICTAAYSQSAPQMISDGSGGAIVVWTDERDWPDSDIYAQRVTSAGVTLWQEDGISVCVFAGVQAAPQLAPDASGGAIICWYDFRGGVVSSDIYAQRIDSQGNVLWQSNGVPICSATAHQGQPQIVADGAGGAIITWTDSRSPAEGGIYAQRVNSSGTTLWTSNGVSLCTATDAQISPQIASDGSGGGVVIWEDYRESYGNWDLYAQRVDSAGNTLWYTDGVSVCIASGAQQQVQIISDGSGGAAISWTDGRAGTDTDIYAQNINSNGDVLWGTDGLSISVATRRQEHSHLASAGNGDVVIAWRDDRQSDSDWDIYAQRVTSAGSKSWQDNGAPVCVKSVASMGYPKVANDNSGGVIVTWSGHGTGCEDDVYAQRLDSNGALLWPSDGIPVTNMCSASQSVGAIAGDRWTGALLVWSDRRVSNNWDIYTQWVAEAPTKTATDLDGPPVYVDDSVKYSIRYTNRSTTTMTDVVVSDTLPTGVDFLTATGSYSGPNPLVWSLGNLAPGQVWTATITGRLDGSVDPVQGNMAAINSSQSGLVKSQSTGTWNIAESLAISKTATVPREPPLHVGDVISYFLTVTNESAATTGVVVQDTLPLGIQFDSATPPGYSGPNPLVWNIGNLGVGAVWTATITVEIDGTTSPIGGNVASVSSDQVSEEETGPIGGWDVEDWPLYLPLMVKN